MGIRTFTTDRGDSGHRIDHVLRRHLADLEAATRTRVQRWIEDGAVSVNGRCVARTSTRIAAGDTISVSIPPAAEVGRPPMLASRDQLDSLFEDEYLLAVNKPAGIVVHPTHAHATGTLMNALLVTLLLAAPWLAAIAYTWSRAPRMDGPPPSMADRTRERLWA